VSVKTRTLLTDTT